MANYEGEGNTATINLGWASLSNINGLISKDNINNNYLNLKWTGVSSTNNTTVKYFITYKNNTFSTTNNNFKLPIGYGSLKKDPKTGIFIVEEVCLTLETRFYFNDGTYSSGKIKTFCFCPPADLYCKNKKTKSVNTTKVVQKNVSTKKRYASAVKSTNGAMGFNFNNCRKVSDWKKLDLKLAASKNDCYKKTDIIILPSQSD